MTIVQEGENIIDPVNLKNHPIDLSDDGDGHQASEKYEENKTQQDKYLGWLQIGLKLLVPILIWGHFGWATYVFITHEGYYNCTIVKNSSSGGSEEEYCALLDFWNGTNISSEVSTIRKKAVTVDETTCSGYGLLIILFAFINFGICYKLTKPYVIPFIRKSVWKPVVNLLSKIPYGPQIFYVLFLVAAIVFLVVDSADDRSRLVPIIGLCFYLSVCFLVSPFKKAIRWRTVFWGLILQFVFGLLTIRWETGRNIFDCLGNKVNTFLGYAQSGAAFAYSDTIVKDLAVFAFSALSTIYFLAFIINILYFYGIMQTIVKNMGRFLQWVMGTSICESVNTAANIFLGQNESPLLIKPYLKYMTDSEIVSIMTSGMATVAGTEFAAYISFGANPAHLITSSVMSAPAALCVTKLIYPETEEIKATKHVIKKTEIEFESVMDAASKGAQDASFIVLSIISNVIAFVALIYFVNGLLGWYGGLLGFVDDSNIWSVELILGKIFTPISWIMGVPWDECQKVGQLIGIKTIVNEFVAFGRLNEMNLTPKSKLIATYSICGFANPGSVGMLISTLGTLIPAKRESITRLAFRAFLGGCIACFMTACIAAMLIPADLRD